MDARLDWIVQPAGPRDMSLPLPLHSATTPDVYEVDPCNNSIFKGPQGFGCDVWV